MSRFGIFKINNIEYDLDDLTLDEVEAIEEQAGAPFSEINYGSAKGMKAFAYVLIKRTNPQVTWEEVGRVKVISFAPAEEDMPVLPPDDQGSSPNGSEPEGYGAPASPGSIAG